MSARCAPLNNPPSHSASQSQAAGQGEPIAKTGSHRRPIISCYVGSDSATLQNKKNSFRCNIRVGVRLTKHRVRVPHLSTISYIQVQKHQASGESYCQSTTRQPQFIQRVSIASSNRKLSFARLRPVAPQTSRRILRDALGCHHHISLYHVVS